MLTALLFVTGCSEKGKLETALDFAKTNRGQLEAVLMHYSHDSLKHAAACYLIENMLYHYYRDEYYLSPSGVEYHPNISMFSGEEEVRSLCDSLIRSEYSIQRDLKFDLLTLSSSYLIENIDLAFEVWKKPWNKDVSFNDFCRYILPYRSGREKPSFLRKDLMLRFLPALDSAKAKTPLQACMVINNMLKNIIRYKNTGLDFYPSIEETYFSGISQCEGLCNIGAYIMRAVGIPIAIEETVWTKMDLAHKWCAVLDNGKFYSFGPGELNPDIHAKSFHEIRRNTPAKVYRTTFDPVKEPPKNNDDGYLTFLKDPLKRDVTNEYLDTTVDIHIEVDKMIHKAKSDQVYLCTYNYYEWTPIALGRIEKKVCSFKDVVGDNIFMIAEAVDGIYLRFITAPFYLDKLGNIKKLIPQKDHTIEFTLDKRKKKLNQIHTLHYWEVKENRFIPINYREATETTQSYDQIPCNALLWFTIPEKIYNQRVFFIENDSLKIY